MRPLLESGGSRGARTPAKLTNRHLVGILLPPEVTAYVISGNLANQSLAILSGLLPEFFSGMAERLGRLTTKEHV